MCDSLTRSVIDSVVDSKVQGGELFTAFDVSLRVQDDLKAAGNFDSDVHRHRYIKNDVHASIDRYLRNDQYQRQLRDVGAPTDAFVYYPQGGDPSNYVPLARTDSPSTSNDPYTINTATAVDSAATPVDTATDGSSDDSGDGRKPDARGTVCVPNYLLRNAGFNPGDSASVYVGKNDLGEDCLIVTKQVPAGERVLTTYTVDSYCNVRVTHSVFVTAGLVSSLYEFDGNSTQVFVKVR